MKRQISRELDRLNLLLEQIKTVAAERDILLVSAAEDTVPTPAKVLLTLKGIGPDFASVLWQEGLFRHLDNRRQVAAHVGLAPTPWQSGSVDREPRHGRRQAPILLWRRCRSSAVRMGMSFVSHSRTVSWLKTIPRSRNISLRSWRMRR